MATFVFRGTSDSNGTPLHEQLFADVVSCAISLQFALKQSLVFFKGVEAGEGDVLLGNVVKYDVVLANKGSCRVAQLKFLGEIFFQS